MSDLVITPKKVKSVTGTTMIDLPSEILVDIASQLKVSKILSCRCVCKILSRTLSFSNSVFSKLHFARSAPMIFVETRDKSRTDTHFIELQDESNLSIGFELMRSGFELIKNNLRVVNSCDGLVCFATHYFDPVLVCNPITGEYIDIPKLEYDSSIKPYIVSGFGCSLKSKEYKVVRLMSNIGKKYIMDEMMRCPFTVKVFTVGTKSWRKIESVPFYLDQKSCITYFRGAIHWVCKDTESNDYIISFDLDTEKFAVIPPPGNVLNERKERLSIGVFDESLYLTHNGELWVMREYGKADSWVNVYDQEAWRYRFTEVVMHLGEGRIAVNVKSTIFNQVVAFNIATKTAQTIPVPAVCNSVGRRLFIHKPSFISIKDAITIPEDGVELEVHESRALPKREDILRDAIFKRRIEVAVERFRNM